MKKLYRAIFEVEAIVAADDGDEAFDVARDFRYDILTDDSPLPLISELNTARPALPFGWDDKCIPFGADNDMRIGEFLTVGVKVND